MSSDHRKYSPSYTKVCLRRWRRPVRRFRLSPARVSLRQMRVKMWTLLGFLDRYVRNLRLLTRGRVAAGSSSPPAAATGSRRFLVSGRKRAAAAGKEGQAASGGNSSNSKALRRPPCMRSNSFYARAVAECLEFIKGSNVPPASPTPLAAHGTPRRSGRC